MIRTYIKLESTFGRWTVKALVKESRHDVYYDCVCSCGTKKQVLGRSLKINASTSCGCLHKEVTSKRNRKEDGYTSFKGLECRTKSGAKSRNYSYTLTFDQFKSIIKKSCHYCGYDGSLYNKYINKDGKINDKEITKDNVNRHWIKVNGIDRKDNNIGYELENCLPCCYQCNQSKSDRTYEEFMLYIKRLINFNKQYELVLPPKK